MSNYIQSKLFLIISIGRIASIQYIKLIKTMELINLIQENILYLNQLKFSLLFIKCIYNINVVYFETTHKNKFTF